MSPGLGPEVTISGERGSPPFINDDPVHAPAREAGRAMTPELSSMPRPEKAQDGIRTILLASDLSSASANAEDLAFELAARLDGALLLVSVIDPHGLWLPTGGYRQRIDQAREARQAAAQGLVDRGRRDGVPVRMLIWEGDPAESIVEAAVAEEVDLIVVGSHQRRGVDRLVMGSVSEQVVRTSPVPVVVARRAIP
jgi:nucleotide-binding universal stress UspA family protein